MKTIWLRESKRIAFIILALTIGVINTAASPVLAQPPEMVKVLIGFDVQPGPAEEALVHSHGGTAKYTYNLVPAIAANLPAQAREALLQNPNVTAVETDLAVHAIDAELENTWGVKSPKKPG